MIRTVDGWGKRKLDEPNIAALVSSVYIARHNRHMLGVVITALVAFGAMGVGRLVVGRWVMNIDRAARVGICGIVGLGVFGLVTLLVGLLPGGLRWGVWLIVALSILGYWSVAQVLRGNPLKLTKPEGADLLFPIAIAVCFLLALSGVLAPSTTMDWDSLAYHLAVPKLWLQAGQIHYISFIHQSNFPSTVDDLYTWGLTWGGQSGAKAFSFAYFVFGVFAVFGVARGRYGNSAGWWAALAFATMPVVLWESGTAYIDVANGLFVGLGIAFAALLVEEPEKREYMWLSAVMLGFAAGSKYTGLQTVLVVGLVVLLYGIASKRAMPALKSSVIIGALAVAIASPWYIKNVVYTGNPVYPFFYSVFGGKNWDAFGAKIYNNQQQTFGAGREMTPGENYTANKLDPSRVGNAILGLAYQPGRYTDPRPDLGLGLPFVALGILPLASLLVWMFSGRMTRFEGAIAISVLVSFAMWFVLTEMSRYIVGLAIALCILFGGAVLRLRSGKALMVVGLLQVAVSLYVIDKRAAEDNLKVDLGQVSLEDFQRQKTAFYDPAQYLNSEVGNGRVALFEELFGFELDVPYFWANPGHTTELGYAQMRNADDFVASLKRLGITHVYLDVSSWNRDDIGEWGDAGGLNGSVVPYPPAKRQQLFSDLQQRWRVLLAEAVASGKLQLIKVFHGSRLIFKVA